jgi:hypothetical protein
VGDRATFVYVIKTLKYLIARMRINDTWCIKMVLLNDAFFIVNYAACRCVECRCDECRGAQHFGQKTVNLSKIMFHVVS